MASIPSNIVAARSKPLISCIAAGGAGMLAVFGWAPFGWWPLVLASYAILFGLIHRTDKTIEAGLIGMAFGLGLHLTGHGWIYTALRTKAGIGVAPAGLGTALFLGYLSAFTAIPCWLNCILIGRHNLPRFAKTQYRLASIVAFACLLTIGEWARSFFFNGFTSLSVGYSLVDTWIAGYAPIAGLYGVSWVGLCIAAMLHCAVVVSSKWAIMAPGIGIAILALTGWGAQQVHWTQASGKPLRFRLIQTNITQVHKFDPLYSGRQVRRLVDLIEEEPADIIATPETAFPLSLNELPAETLTRLQHFVEHSRSHVFAGIVTSAADANGYNSLLHIAPSTNSAAITQYNKARLMPFGEYSPVGFGWFTRMMSISLKDMSAGRANQPPFLMAAQDETQILGALICHEDLIGRDARRWGESANIILNPSNLAWFDGSLAIGQNLQIVRMRALEIGRPILRIANTGVTAYLNAQGDVVSALPTEREGVLSGVVQPAKGRTPYVQFGDNLMLALSTVGILLVVVLRRYRRR
ncbi:apolipoprotein N-acyltransferase [Herbaspirillum sp. HC18]|nr:apolipoprotein N-acyltransferase [Herbaspirillum sp. HC18]